MRQITKIAALALLPLVLGGHARADEPKVITLFCEGTLTPTTVLINQKPLSRCKRPAWS